MKVELVDVCGKNYALHILDLYSEITPDKCTSKVRRFRGHSRMCDLSNNGFIVLSAQIANVLTTLCEAYPSLSVRYLTVLIHCNIQKCVGSQGSRIN